MQFESITLNNFMRYKGENRIEFSCDEKKNVTIVLGDNTVGKTTIAQAFRWGLYGSLLVEHGKKESDYVLLNKDVISLMDSNSRASVSVTLCILNGGKRYTLFREITYKRNYPSYEIKELYQKKSLQFGEQDESECVDIEEGKIDDVIKEMLPMDLSHYFLFDGEKWNDVSVNGVKENIKESVHKLTGLSAVQKAMFHIKDMGSGSVLTKMRGKIKGGGAIFESLKSDSEMEERRIVKWKEELVKIDGEMVQLNRNIQEVEKNLEENKSTEIAQAKLKACEKSIGYFETHLNDPYRNVVEKFSENGKYFFSEPMMQACLKILKEANLQRKDIPHMRQATIDYILKNKKCICGTEITEGSEACNCLLELRNYLPPADMGSLVGEFEMGANRWRAKSADFVKTVEERAAEVKAIHVEYNEKQSEIQEIERGMGKNIDFAQKRTMLRQLRASLDKKSSEKGQKMGEIDAAKKHIERLNNEIEQMETKNAENAKWKERMNLVNRIYAQMKEDFDGKEQRTFLSLNQRIQSNFERMFNAKDKKIELDKNYNINMLYKTENGYAVENNLSEGEKVARNFAFITTIMSYEKEQKDAGDDQIDTLPIVLDGPFSKLGQENIRLVAQALPEIADQVIIFMLEKDWEYTGLNDYVGARYHIDKPTDKGFASISKVRE